MHFNHNSAAVLRHLLRVSVWETNRKLYRKHMNSCLVALILKDFVLLFRMKTRNPQYSQFRWLVVISILHPFQSRFKLHLFDVLQF